MSQFTTVTGTVRDPTGRIYQDGSFSVNFVDPGTSGQLSSLSNGQQFQTSFSGALDSFGFFSVTLADNGQIASASGEANTKWQFVISASANILQLPVGVPVPTFSYTTAINCSSNVPNTCIGGSIDISAQLQVVAAFLPPIAGGVITFNGAPTGPCTPAQIAVDTTTGNFYACNATVWQKVGPGSGALSSPVTAPNPINFDVDLHFKGLDPYVDITRYGARSGATTNAPLITVNCTSGVSNVTLSGAGDFVNGDGVTLYGCGATLALSTPPAPTVTPSVAAAGTGVGYVVNGNTGTTHYWYTRAARDQAGGLTAAGAVTALTTGQPKLGSQLFNLGVTTRSGFTVTTNTAIYTLTAAANASGGNTTYTGTITSIATPTAVTNVVIAGFTNAGNNGTFLFVSATATTITVANSGGVAEAHAGTAQQQHNLVAGAMVRIHQIGDGTFAGDYNVLTTPSSTSFTYQCAVDTAAGATTSTTGGTAEYFNVNHITWTDDGSWQSYVWVSTVSSSGPWTLVEPSWPGRQLVSSWADDYGTTMETGVTVPYFVPPTTPPASALNDPLTTTIASGAGTTTLTLAVAPSNSTTATTILHDDAPAMVAAMNTFGLVYIPNGGFVVNSFMTVPTAGNGVMVWQQGSVTVNDTIALRGNWQGGIVPKVGTQQFAFTGGAGINTGRSWPAFYLAGGPTKISDFTMSLGSRNALGFLCDTCLNTTISRSGISSPGGNPDYLGKAFVGKGVFANNPSWFFFKDNTWTATQTGGTATPFFYCQDCGQMEIDNLNLSGRGVMFSQSTDVNWNHGRVQGCNQSVLTSVSENTGFGGPNINWSNYELDTTANSSLAIIGAGGQTNPASTVYMRNVGSPSTDGVSAPINICGSTTSSSITNIIGGNIVSNSHLTQGYSGIKITSPTPIVNSGQGSSATIGYQMALPAAPVTSVSGVGTLPVGTWYYYVQAVDALGNATLAGAISNGTTVNGSQSVLITFPAVQSGQVSWNICRGNAPGNIACAQGGTPSGGFNVPISNLTYTDTGSNLSPTNSQVGSFAATAFIGKTSIGAQNLTLVGSNGFTSTFSGTLTANRTITVPDLSFTLGAGGAVTSVGLALPPQYTISGSPVTTTGTLTGAWLPQPAGYFLGGPQANSLGGIFDGTIGTTGTGTTTAASLTPTGSHDLVFSIVEAQGQSSPPTMPGGWTATFNNGNNEAIFRQVFSSNATVSAPMTLNASSTWAQVLFALRTPAGTPTIVQSNSVGGAFGNTTSVSFTSNTTTGNNILAIQCGVPASGAVQSTKVTDALGQTYTQVGSSQNGANEYCTASMAASITGATTPQITFTSNNGIGPGFTNSFLWIAELSNLSTATGEPVFQPIAASSLPTGGPPVNTFSSTTLGSDLAVSASTQTTVMTRVVTMPSTGCPCRAFVSYSLYVTTASSGIGYTFAVGDGTNTFATTATGQSNGSSGALTSASYGGFSTATYANNAAVTFTLTSFGDHAFTVKAAPPAGGTGTQSSFQVAIVPSN